jgi:DNA-binding Lrp family transcriptional regulator
MPRGKIENWDEEMYARAAGLKRAGFSQPEIAKRLGVPVGSVRARMRMLGVKSAIKGRSMGIGQFRCGPLTRDYLDSPHIVDEFLGMPEREEEY